MKESIEKKFTRTLEIRKTSHFKKPLESNEALTQCFEFDVGHYPLSPWLNRHTNDPKLEEMKKFSFFLPPKSTGLDDIFVVSYGECSTHFEFRPHLEPKLLSQSSISMDEFEGCI